MNLLIRLLKYQAKIFFKTYAIMTGVVAALVVCAFLFTAVFSLDEATQAPEAPKVQKIIYGESDSDNRILSIPIRGVIIGTKSELGELGGLLADNMTFGYEIAHQLSKAAQDKSVKAVILDINSPGGTIYGAHAISQAVEQYKKVSKKPVYAFISGVAASGAYWSAVSADRIIADYGSLTGSIGVISGPYRFYDKVTAINGSLFDTGIVTQNGIDEFYITAGESKDLGNPFRKMSQQEIEHEQTAVNNEYKLFVQHVAARRNIAPDVIRSSIGARVFENERALSNRLIDAVQDRFETYELLAKSLDLESYQVVQQEAAGSLINDLLITAKQNKATPLSACAVVSRQQAMLAINASQLRGLCQ